MNRLEFSPSTKRLPLFGLGCVAGAASIARLSDYLKAYPKRAAVLLSVELCSLTFQVDDLSTANVIACGLFGDGAAAVLLVGDEHPACNGHPRVVDTRSVLFPHTERVMGWDVVDTGFRIVLDTSVPELARTALPRAVHEFLREHELSVGAIDPWLAHPGGPAVIDGMERGLELEAVRSPRVAKAGAVSGTCRRRPCSWFWTRLCRSAPAAAAATLCCWRWAQDFARSSCCSW